MFRFSRFVRVHQKVPQNVKKNIHLDPKCYFCNFGNTETVFRRPQIPKSTNKEIPVYKPLNNVTPNKLNTDSTSGDALLLSLREGNAQTSTKCPFSSSQEFITPQSSKYSQIIHNIEKNINELDSQTFNIEDLHLKNISHASPGEGCYFQNEILESNEVTPEENEEQIYEDEINQNKINEEIFGHNLDNLIDRETEDETLVFDSDTIQDTDDNEEITNEPESSPPNPTPQLIDVSGVGITTKEMFNSFGIYTVEELLELENNKELYEKIYDKTSRVQRILQNAKSKKFKKTFA